MKMLMSLLLGGIVLLQAGNDQAENTETNVQKQKVAPDMSKFVSRHLHRAPPPSIESCKSFARVYSSDTEYIITNEEFSPLPVTLKVINGKGVTVLEKTNEHNVTSHFEIPVDQLKEDTKLKIFNADDKLIFCKKVIFLR